MKRKVNASLAVAKRPKKEKLSDQMSVKKEVKEKKEFDGNIETMISTGSTLLDLAISGGRVRGGGIPGGILMEAFGPSGAGKTVLLCELAGAVQRQGGMVMFKDPEARLNKQFARIFDYDIADTDYDTPDTVPEVFKPIRAWETPNNGKVHGIFTDSLASLSTKMEMEDEDKMGMRRAKEFSEQCRKTTRIIPKKNYLMCCSNQIRQNPNAGPYGQKYVTPGGESIAFYSSLRLRFSSGSKIKKELKLHGKKVTRIIGIETIVEVFKSSIWKPYHTAPLNIVFDYGIDDIRANLKFLKSNTTATTYVLGDENLGKSIEDAIAAIEKGGLEHELKEAVIDLWESIELKFEVSRKKKKR